MTMKIILILPTNKKLKHFETSASGHKNIIKYDLNFTYAFDQAQS